VNLIRRRRAVPCAAALLAIAVTIAGLLWKTRAAAGSDA
jgi:hypothetical protein